jgi:hypothetical protein
MVGIAELVLEMGFNADHDTVTDDQPEGSQQHQQSRGSNAITKPIRPRDMPRQMGPPEQRYGRLWTAVVVGRNGLGHKPKANLGLTPPVTAVTSRRWKNRRREHGFFFADTVDQSLGHIRRPGYGIFDLESVW